MYMKKLIFSIFLLCLNVPAYSDSENNFNIDIGYNHDDNVNRSPVNNRALDDQFFILGAGFNHHRSLSHNSFINYQLLLKHEIYNQYTNINNTEASIGFSYHIKPEGGFSKATYIIKSNLRIADFKTDLRDRTSYDITGMMSFWVTNTTSLRTGISYRNHDSDSSVYDAQNVGLFLSSDIHINQDAIFYTSLNLLKGDIISSIALTGYYDQILDVIRQADDIEADDSFAPGMIAYRVDSQIMALSFGYNHVISHQHSIDFSTRYAYGKADYNVDYQTLIFSLNYLASFSI